jgi:hypothetical protein
LSDSNSLNHPRDNRVYIPPGETENDGKVFVRKPVRIDRITDMRSNGVVYGIKDELLFGCLCAKRSGASNAAIP